MARERDVVKYHNNLNNLSMRNWSAEEMDLFFTLIMKIRDKGTDIVRLDAEKLKILTGTETRNSYWYKMVDSFSYKSIQLRYRFEDDKTVQYSSLFQRIKFDKEERNLEIKLAEDFEYIVNKLTKNFTVWELKEFTQLSSTYSKTMYRILKQWRTVGSKEFSIDKFRILLDIPNSYNTSSIQRAVINPILKELPQYFEGLKVKVIKANTQGTPVKAYRFTWRPEPTGEWDPNKYIETKSHKASKQKYYRNGTPKPDEREYPDEEIESYYFYAVSENDDDLDTKEIDNSKIKDSFEDETPIFGGQLGI
jgi:plasmid replication initiation protein